MTDRTLAALGFDAVPALAPLVYPGRPVTAPALLYGGELWELTARPGPPGTWQVRGPGTAPEPLDTVLSRLGLPTTDQRHAVLAVGSNASPAQLGHKLTAAGRPGAVPMVPVRVRGVGVGCSAHIGRHGYVACAPYPAPATDTTLVVSWLDTAQLAVVDATEANYGRIRLSADDCPMTLPSGELLDGAYLYVSSHGLLAAEGRAACPLPGGGEQSALLSGLLARSARLRELLGTDAVSWVARASADPAVREAGRRVFREEGWVLPRAVFPVGTAATGEGARGSGAAGADGHALLSSLPAGEPPTRRLSS